MRTQVTIPPTRVRRRSPGFLHSSRFYLLPFVLGVGSIVSAGCVAAPAVMITSAAVTAAAVAVEGEKVVHTPDTQSSAIAKNEADVAAGHGKGCLRKGPLPEEDQTDAHERQEARNDCSAGRQQKETIRGPNSPKI